MMKKLIAHGFMVYMVYMFMNWLNISYAVGFYASFGYSGYVNYKAAAQTAPNTQGLTKINGSNIS